MNCRVYNFDQPDRFVCGTVGEPGQRTFYLQATKGERVVSVALEKAQVAVLAERLATLLLALRRGGLDVGEEQAVDDGMPRLAEPVIESFRVGTLTLGWDGDREQVVIEAREMSDEDDGEDEDDDSGEGAIILSEGFDEDEPIEIVGLGSGPDVVRVQLKPDAALEFASGAVLVVQAGRPPCPLCGAPLDPTGHFCARRNGKAN